MQERTLGDNGSDRCTDVLVRDGVFGLVEDLVGGCDGGGEVEGGAVDLACADDGAVGEVLEVEGRVVAARERERERVSGKGTQRRAGKGSQWISIITRDERDGTRELGKDDAQRGCGEEQGRAAHDVGLAWDY